MNMKKIGALALLALITVTGCTTSNQYGECKGLVNEGEKDPRLNYEVSTGNVILSVLFGGSLVWPGLTAAFWVWCPTGPKAGSAPTR
jgi:hypothetical protein